MTGHSGSSYRLVVVLAGAVALNGCGSGASNPAGSEPQATQGTAGFDAVVGGLGTPLGVQLAQARAATARYHDVSVALEDGFFRASPCISGPAGTMGFHYVNPSRLDDTAAIEEPEVLLYLEEDGEWQLVAVEYVVPVFQDGRPYFGTEPPADPGPRPELFGKAFAGPMPGHAPGEPWHYDLHVWVWSHNPAGMFAPFNPSLSCS